MSKDTKDFKKKITDYKLRLGFLEKQPCSHEENLSFSQYLHNGKSLPEDVKSDCSPGLIPTSFFRIKDSGLKDSEIQAYLLSKQFFEILRQGEQLNNIKDSLKKQEEAVKRQTELLTFIKNCCILLTGFLFFGILSVLVLALSKVV
ncbi:MAG: hypothetical protein Q8882_01440 [Bacillota bacterium]|nr:hypothetical protein [Bacillota bacterium]